MTDQPLDELDQALRDLRIEQIPRRVRRRLLTPVIPADQRRNFLTLAKALGGLTRYDIAHLRAQGHTVTDIGEIER